MSKKKKDYGWDFLNSSKSGSYNGSDGSWGYKNTDGSGSWNGADGSWGYWNSDGTSSYYGKDNEIDQDSFDSGSKLASGLAGFLTELGSQAINNSSKKNNHNYSNSANKIKNDKDDWKFWLVLFGFMFCVMIFCSIMYFIVVQESKPDDNEIKIPISAKKYKGENYKQVKEEFENIGFENIECVGLNDLITGWIDTKNSIEKISIDGDTKFEEGDIFNKDAEVVISYHSFKKKSNSP